MKTRFYRRFALIAALFFAFPLFTLSAQQKYALVIGNGAYTSITRLNNPVNDARDMEAALKSLGWNVDLVINGTLDQMEGAAARLKNRLSVFRNSYGFLFYAGHGVQSSGENYLIPVDANIQSENYLRQRAVSVQVLLDELNDAGNELNVVVLDACRDNPFSWRRSGTRGLQVVGSQPADSIIVYATSAGSTAADGTGRNSPFTGHLLNNLKTPGLEVTEVFRRTMGDVARASNNQQRPAVYNQFPGIAYLGAQPAQPSPVTPAVNPPQPRPIPVTPAVVTPQPAPGTWSLIRTLSWHSDGVTSVTFSPDGRRIASGSKDNTANIWDSETGALICSLSGYGDDAVWSVAFSPDGRRLASGSGDTVKVWDAETGALIRTLSGHGDLVTSVAFSPDGRRLASGAQDNTVKIWGAGK